MKKSITFLFSQIGLGVLVVAYCFIGGVIFQHIERQHEIDLINEQKDYVHKELGKSVQELWNVTVRLNILDPDHWQAQARDVILEYVSFSV